VHRRSGTTHMVNWSNGLVLHEVLCEEYSVQWGDHDGGYSAADLLWQ
jgi:hypothetical protein